MFSPSHDSRPGGWPPRLAAAVTGLLFSMIGWSTFRYPPNYISTSTTTAFLFFGGGLAALARASCKACGTHLSTWLGVASGTMLVVGCFVRSFDMFYTGGWDAIVQSFTPAVTDRPRQVSLFVSAILWAFVGVALWVSWGPLLARMDGDEDG